MQSMTEGRTARDRTGSDDQAAEPAIVDSVLHTLLAAGRLMRQHTTGEGLDPGVFWLLKLLHEQGAMRVTDLAACAKLDPSTISRHVSQLERSQLVERTPDPDDRRAQQLVLTDQGRLVLQQAYDGRRRVLRAAFDHWTGDDVRQFDHFLGRFLADLTAYDPTLESA